MAVSKRGEGHDLALGDWCCVAYSIATGALIAAHRATLPDWPARLLVHAAMIAGALLLARRAPTDGAWGLARLYYPAVFFAHGYLELAAVQPLLAGGYLATGALARADLWLFGVHPTEAVQRLYGLRPLDEAASLVYLSYYAVPFVVTVPWLRAGRRDLVLWGAGIAALTFLVGAAIFFAVPALGPRRMPELRALHGAAHAGPVFGRLVHAIEGDAGAVPGGVFPSLHVALTAAWAVTAGRAGSPSAPATVAALAMAPAAVYLGYHHAVDVIAGLVLGPALAFAVPRPAVRA